MTEPPRKTPLPGLPPERDPGPDDPTVPGVITDPLSTPFGDDDEEPTVPGVPPPVPPPKTPKPERQGRV